MKLLVSLFSFVAILNASCSQKKKHSEIDIYECFINKKNYVLQFGDTIEIYRFYNGINVYSKPDTNLTNVRYIDSKIVYSEEECAGCTTVTADRFVAFEKGNDTIFYPYFSFSENNQIDADTFCVVIK